jgi:hypothetical protein
MLLANASFENYKASTSAHTIGVESIRISVGQRTSSSKRSSSGVAVAVVLSTRAVHSGSVSLLVKDGGSLILLVARARKSGELVEEQRAVRDVVVRWESVGEDVGLAGTVDVGAIGTGLTAGGRGAVRGDSAEACSNGATGRRGGSLEVLLELRCRARSSGGGSSSGQSVAVAESSADRGQASAGAVALDGGALGKGLQGSIDLGGLCGVDVDRKLVAGVGKDSTGESGGVGLCVLNDTLGEHIVLAALGEVVELRKFDLDLDGLASSNRLEGVLGEGAGSHALEQAKEIGLGGWDVSASIRVVRSMATRCHKPVHEIS